MSVGSDNLVWNWRRLTKYFRTHPAKNSKGTDKDGNEDDPEFFHEQWSLSEAQRWAKRVPTQNSRFITVSEGHGAENN
jgi:hypothetical protein